MAQRPIFLPVSRNGKAGIQDVSVTFDWFPGFSLIQKQKSIQCFHNVAIERGICKRPLEISSKSPVDLGRKLSAFFLKLKLPNGLFCPVECAFQGGKVFELGGPFLDLFEKEPKEAKRDLRLLSMGNLKGFEFFGKKWGLSPKTAFYDWLYLSAIMRHTQLIPELLTYDAFTDIEFNPNKSINCQAKSAALFISLHENKLLEKFFNMSDVFDSAEA